MNFFSKKSTLTAGILVALMVLNQIFAQNQSQTETLQTQPPNTDIIQRPDPTIKLVNKGKALIENEDYHQAIEALRTAISSSLVATEAWDLYDQAVISEYISANRRQRFSTAIEQDSKSIFAINQIDSYYELNTLYVVGSVRNLSSHPRQKIVILAQILDANKKELRHETGNLRLTDRGLFPNESSLFEIPFKSPPEGAHSYKVEVFEYE